MADYKRTWRTERRPLDLDRDTPTGRALVWPTIIGTLSLLYVLGQVVRWWVS